MENRIWNKNTVKTEDLLGRTSIQCECYIQTTQKNFSSHFQSYFDFFII